MIYSLWIQNKYLYKGKHREEILVLLLHRSILFYVHSLMFLKPVHTDIKSSHPSLVTAESFPTTQPPTLYTSRQPSVFCICQECFCQFLCQREHCQHRRHCNMLLAIFSYPQGASTVVSTTQTSEGNCSCHKTLH